MVSVYDSDKAKGIGSTPGSLYDPYTRFVSLPPDLQEWYDHTVTISPGELYIRTVRIEATPDNVQAARAIARHIPIRLRWFKKARWGKYYRRSLISEATHFTIQCRLGEKRKRGYEKLD